VGLFFLFLFFGLLMGCVSADQGRPRLHRPVTNSGTRGPPPRLVAGPPGGDGSGNSQGEQPKPKRYRRIRNVLRSELGRTHDAVMVVNEGPGEHRHEATGLMANCVKVGLGRSRSPALGNQGHPSIR